MAVGNTTLIGHQGTGKGRARQGPEGRHVQGARRQGQLQADDRGATSTSKRYTPPNRTTHMPSPIWVPILMFALLGIGMLLIILNYAGVFGAAENWRLVLGLALILAGILTATQYR